MSDWAKDIILKKTTTRAAAKSKSAVNCAQRTGVEIETSKKRTGGQNKQYSNDKNTSILSAENECFHHDRVAIDVSKLIQQARQNKGLTQKELATKINEKTTIVTEYEQAKAIPNQGILIKMERVLGVKLRGKDKGKAL